MSTTPFPPLPASLPLPEGAVLPASAYTSQEWYDREQIAIFGDTWAFAGLVEDVAEPGAYVTAQVGRDNLIVVMGRDRRLRAFHNICRHRGTRLLRAVGRGQKAITCPYHDWTYNLEGELVSVPEEAEEFPGLKKRCLNLHAASVDTWRGMIFVHPDPEAESLAQWFGAVEPYLGPHRPAELPEWTEGRHRFEIKANWKIVAENFLDLYHLGHLHSATLAMYDHSRIQGGFVGPHFVSYDPVAASYGENLARNAAMPLIDHVPREHAGAWAPWLFPSLGLVESESSWSTFHVTPLAPDRTAVELRIRVADVPAWRFTAQSWRSAGFWSRHLGRKVEGDPATDPLATGDFMAEDTYACEAHQASLTSSRFGVGAMARVAEAPVRAFQQLVRDRVEQFEAKSGGGGPR